jgi:hypothetical protein
MEPVIIVVIGKVEPVAIFLFARLLHCIKEALIRNAYMAASVRYIRTCYYVVKKGTPSIG